MQRGLSTIVFSLRACIYSCGMSCAYGREIPPQKNKTKQKKDERGLKSEDVGTYRPLHVHVAVCADTAEEVAPTCHRLHLSSMKAQ